MAKPLTCRLAVLGLVWLLLAACSGSISDGRPTQGTSPLVATVHVTTGRRPAGALRRRQTMASIRRGWQRSRNRWPRLIPRFAAS